MVCFVNSPIADSPIADQREAMVTLAALKSNKTAKAAKSAGPANGTKKAMLATKATEEAMQKSRPNETKKPRVCRCMGCTNCFSAHATLPKPPPPCKKTLHTGGLCSGCRREMGTAAPSGGLPLAPGNVKRRRYTTKRPPRFPVPLRRKRMKSQAGLEKSGAIPGPAGAVIGPGITAVVLPAAASCDKGRRKRGRHDLILCGLTTPQVATLRSAVENF